MFHLQSVPFVCPYQVEITCPVAVQLSEHDPEKRCLTEALPCQVCPHYLDGAQALFAQRRVQLGRLGRQILTVVRERGTAYFPLHAALRTDQPQRVNLYRLHKALDALEALRALRTCCLPTVVPCADNSLRLVLRETRWVQGTAVGEVLSDFPVGQHRAGWRTHQTEHTAGWRTRRTTLAQTDLLSVYIQQVVTLVTAVTHHLVAATEPVMVARCTSLDSPYVAIFTHLETIDPVAHAALQQMYVRALEARRRAISLYHAAEQQRAQSS
ncbi:MAG: hypothetical protein HOP18_19355 [Deltaproteobacteria bacterium]|nr:hypothetical protein [Deltaproteobacteria bacterium]